jgi:hypothetical protein
LFCRTFACFWYARVEKEIAARLSVRNASLRREREEKTIVRGTKQRANLVFRSIVQKYLLIFSRRPRQLDCRHYYTLIEIVKKRGKRAARDKKKMQFFLCIPASVERERG